MAGAGEAAKPELGRPEDRIARIAQAAQALETEAGDVLALAEVARGALALGEQALAKRAFALLAELACERGQLATALLASKELGALDAASAKKQIAEIGAAYGAGSARVDAERRLPPPAPRNWPTPGKAPTQAALLELVGKVLDRVAAELMKLAASPARLPTFPLFHALDVKSFERLFELMTLRKLAADTVVIEQGSAASAFYVLARGRVRIERDNPGKSEGVVLSRLSPGAFFGEMALLGDTVRTAKAVAEADTEVFEIARAPLEKLAGEVPRLAEVLAEHCRDRLIANLMVTSALFRELGPADRRALASRFTRRVFAPGARIISEGAEGDGIYVVVSGAAEVRKKDAQGDQVLLTVLRPGDVFGEMSVLGRRPAQAGIKAQDKTATLFLPREAFDEVVKQFPQLLAHLYQLQVTRERDNERLLAAEPIEADDYLI